MVLVPNQGQLRYWCLAGATIAMASLGTMGLYAQGWRHPAIHCYFQTTLGFIGPGCGLTRSILACWRGDWALALQYHAFGPMILLALVGLVGGGVAGVLFPARLLALGRSRGLSMGLIGVALGGTLAFWGYYGLRLMARYADDRLPAALHHLPLWSFLVSSAHLV